MTDKEKRYGLALRIASELHAHRTGEIDAVSHSVDDEWWCCVQAILSVVDTYLDVELEAARLDEKPVLNSMSGFRPGARGPFKFTVIGDRTWVDGAITDLSDCDDLDGDDDGIFPQATVDAGLADRFSDREED